MPEKERNNIARQARIELDRMALKNMRFTFFVSLVLSLIYGALVFSEVESERLRLWLVVMLVSLLLRFLSERHLSRIGISDRNDQWRRGFFIFKCLVLAGAAVWGGAAILVFPENDLYLQMVLVSILLGISAGALSSMASVVRLYRSYILLMLLPLMGRFLYEGGIHGVTIATLMGLYLATLFLMADKIYRSIHSSVTLRLENESLLHEVFTSKCALEQVNVELQEEIREHKEARRQLEEAQRRVAAAAQAKSRFMTNMSHELKTPMTGITGVSRQLRQTPLSDEQKNLLAELDRCSSELLLLIDNLLDFTELEKKDVVLNAQVFDLQLLFDELREIFASRAARKGLSLAVVPVAEELRWLLGDAYRLKQVLFNLLDNAVKFTGQGGVKLFVTEAGGASGGARRELLLKFCVEDSGPGIDADKHEIIFSAFSQLDDSLTRDSGGAGVGLAISRKLVELMSGRIWCESTPGQGARFCFQVPLCLAEKPEELESAAAVPASRAEGRPGILIVDDNKLNRKLLRAVLERRNFDPLMAENGLEALEILAREGIDLIFMDIQMPVLDGLSATRIIRGLENGVDFREIEEIKSGLSPELLHDVRQRIAGGHIVVISITANILSGNEKEFVHAGFDYNLRKPFQPEDVYAVLHNYLSRDNPAGTGAAEGGAGSDPEERGDGGSVIAATDPDVERDAIFSKDQVVRFLRDKYHLDEDAIGLMVDSLRDSLNSGFAEAKQALAENDLDRLGRVAHSIKGSLANVGFFELADMAHEIEISVSEEPELPYAEMVARLQKHLAEVMK